LSKALEFMEEVFRAAASKQPKTLAIAAKQGQAKEILSRSSFPTAKDEDWKYYDLADILNTGNGLLRSARNDSSDSHCEERSDEAIQALENIRELIATHVFPETVSHLLVTLNGEFSPELSTLKPIKGLQILDFNSASNSAALKILETHYAEDLEEETNLFKIINSSLMNNGFLLYVEDGTCIKEPLQILHICNQNSFNQIRSLIYLGKNSELKISVADIGVTSKYCSNTVVETVLAEGARLKLDKIQDESKLATRLYDLSVNQARDSYFEFNGFSFGAASGRDDISVNLMDKGAEANISGLYVVNGKRKSHHKIVVNHLSGHTKSEQLFKGLLDDEARAEFNGLIDIAEGCPQVAAAQLNSNLLLSRDAHIDSRPQLNILSDDVKANHGSSTGQLDEDQLFYLQSRGLSLDEAKIVLTYSFCREVINKVEIESARDYISKLAVKNLSSSLKADLDNRSVIKQCLTDTIIARSAAKQLTQSVILSEAKDPLTITQKIATATSSPRDDKN